MKGFANHSEATRCPHYSILRNSRWRTQVPLCHLLDKPLSSGIAAIYLLLFNYHVTKAMKQTGEQKQVLVSQRAVPNMELDQGQARNATFQDFCAQSAALDKCLPNLPTKIEWMEHTTIRQTSQFFGFWKLHRRLPPF